MRTIQLDRRDSTVRSICAALGYRGRKIKAELDYIPDELNSYWDGGSKDSYSFYELSTKRIVHLESNHPCFEPNKPRTLKELPKGIILIRSSIFCGKHAGLTLYSNPEDRTLFIGG